ncbi:MULTISPECIES: TPR domain-containing protein [Vibrio]|uniref:TPR domain-containing protein n=1 Tax=Vibrio TaxID=662 RepID=UPI0006586D3D|nr:nitrite reductase [Vibrio sp. VPAP30]KLN62937.1 nitrite reductase [Vibrio sp. VPAP30]
MKRVLLASLVIAVPVYIWLQGQPPAPIAELEPQQTHQEWMSSLQDQLKQDPNQAELWFQLGHGYLNNQDFPSALTCFDYAVRLSHPPSANQLAAKATALYYVHKQRMTPEVSSLLEQALVIEANNLTALTLIASDHFISFRYQEAIDTWTRMLDSNHPELDREMVIRSLNQAKALNNG